MMTLKHTIRTAVGAAIALSFAAVPAPALAGPFTPEGQQHWIATVHALIEAANAGTSEMGAACAGVNMLTGGSEIRHEYFQVPKWAYNVHFRTCVAYKIMSADRRTVSTSGDACKTLQSAIDELGKAKAGTEPDEIVALAGQLRTRLVSLVTDLRGSNTCTFASGRLL